MATSRKPSSRSRKQRIAALSKTLAPQLAWNNCGFSVIVSFIDPCSPCWELHTNSKAEALNQWEQWARSRDKTGGEWEVALFAHPTDRPTTRTVLRRELRGWIYHMSFPRSSRIRYHDYMMPRLTNPNE